MRRFLAIIGWLAAASSAWAAGADFEARLWTPDLGGTARVGDGANATTIDLTADLGFADDQALEGRLSWRPTRRISVRLDYASFGFSADAQLDRTLTFGDQTFDLDAQVSSLLDLEYGGLGLGWQFLSTRDGRVRLGPVVEARGLRGEAGISTNVLGILPLSAREEFEAAFAAAGLLLDVEPSRKVHLTARWSTSVETDDGNLTDLEAAVRYFPLATLAITAGYRRVEIDAADGDEMFDVELDGPFFGAVLRF